MFISIKFVKVGKGERNQVCISSNAQMMDFILKVELQMSTVT